MISKRRSWLRHGGRFLLPSLAVLGLMWLAPAANPSSLGSPSISYTITGIAGTNGWYRGSSTGEDYVVLHWAISDPSSQVASTSGCELAIRIDGPTTGTTRTCTATLIDNSQISVTTSPIKIDADPPTGVSATAARSPDHNGWYNHAVGISWSGNDVTSGIASCTSLTYSGPDSSSAAPGGTCTDQAGNASAVNTYSLKYDDTAPGVTASAARSADANGWYNHAVTISWSAIDSTSGVASCTSSINYNGPDSASAAPSGTCIDQAGNSASVAFPLKFDATAPTGISAAAARGPDQNGWYNHSVGIAWSGSDATSGIASCTSINYAGPDSANATPSGTCTDRAGNTSSAVSFSLKFDDTAPAVSVGAGRGPDGNGWDNHAVTVTWSGSDAVSGLDACSSLVTYSGPDSASASVPGSCSDKAGNTTSTTFPLKFDATAPTVTATPSRSADVNGWYNHPVTITWSATDATSGVDTCSAAKTYSGPDGPDAASAGTCTDKAGNVGSASSQIKYDATPPAVSPAPSRAPDSNGWYNHALTIGWGGAEPPPGGAPCTPPGDYKRPDNATASTSGTCTDNAGNTAPSVSFGFKFDATPPAATSAAAAQSPDQSGWYNHPVLITWAGTDNLSGIGTCTSSAYNGPDSATGVASGSCTDAAGNRSAPLTFPLKFDATAPVVSATPGRVADANGWYNHAVSIAWSGSDATSGLPGRTPAPPYTGPDAASAAPSGSCTDKAGNAAALAFPLRYDATAPAVSARADRAPDHNGWYNHPLSVQFVGDDGVSGVDSCTASQYGGPGGKGIVANGSCSDRAGNVGFASFSIDYDAEAPTVTGFSVESQPSADVVRWKPSSLEDIATIIRTARRGRPKIVYRGGGDSFVDKRIRSGVEYRYSVQTQDEAGNESRRLSRLALPKQVTLRNGSYIPRTAGAPVLRMPAVAGASYYHVQLFRHGKRILAAWPLRPQLSLRTSWKWAGHSYRLSPGRYRWFGWAGFGKRAAARYKLLGSAYFVVSR